MSDFVYFGFWLDETMPYVESSEEYERGNDLICDFYNRPIKMKNYNKIYIEMYNV